MNRIRRVRTLRHDLEFGINRLVEIALRELAGLPAFDGGWRTRAGAPRLPETPLRFRRPVKAAYRGAHDLPAGAR